MATMPTCVVLAVVVTMSAAMANAAPLRLPPLPPAPTHGGEPVVLWNHSTTTAAFPAAYDGFVYTVEQDNGGQHWTVLAFHAHSGAPAWTSAQLIPFDVYGRLVTGDGALVYYDKNRLYVFNYATGSLHRYLSLRNATTVLACNGEDMMVHTMTYSAEHQRFFWSHGQCVVSFAASIRNVNELTVVKTTADCLTAAPSISSGMLVVNTGNECTLRGFAIGTYGSLKMAYKMGYSPQHGNCIGGSATSAAGGYFAILTGILPNVLNVTIVYDIKTGNEVYRHEHLPTQGLTESDYATPIVDAAGTIYVPWYTGVSAVNKQGLLWKTTVQEGRTLDWTVGTLDATRGVLLIASVDEYVGGHGNTPFGCAITAATGTVQWCKHLQHLEQSVCYKPAFTQGVVAFGVGPSGQWAERRVGAARVEAIVALQYGQGPAPTPSPPTPPPGDLIVQKFFNASMSCRGSGNTVTQRTGCVQTGRERSVLRLCAGHGTLLIEQSFDNSPECSGIPNRTASTSVGKCYSLALESYEVAVCPE